MRVVVVRSDKLIKLITSGRGRRVTRCSSHDIGYMGHHGKSDSKQIRQELQHRCAGAHNLLDHEERTMENEMRIT